MGEEPFTQEDFDFLVYYGKSMASIQEFEFAMIRLARLIVPQLSEGVPFEPAWNRMEKQFKKANGPLAKPLVEAVGSGTHLFVAGTEQEAEQGL